MPKCPWEENRRVPGDCKSCPHFDKEKGCLKTYFRNRKLERHHRMPDGKLVAVGYQREELL